MYKRRIQIYKLIKKIVTVKDAADFDMGTVCVCLQVDFLIKFCLLPSRDVISPILVICCHCFARVHACVYAQGGYTVLLLHSLFWNLCTYWSLYGIICCNLSIFPIWLILSKLKLVLRELEFYFQYPIYSK